MKAKKIFPEFTLLQWFQITSKLFWLIQSSFENGDDDQMMNKKALGYHHTYLKAHDICLSMLSDFPTDQSIQQAIDMAYKEAHLLWTQLSFVSKATMGLPTIVSLPSIQELLQSSIPREVHNIVRDDDSDYEIGDHKSDVDDDNVPIFWKTKNCRASSQLEATIQESLLTGPKSTSVLYALVALDMETSHKIVMIHDTRSGN